MASITGWGRIVGSTRRADLRPGLAATIHDPLWLLARQKQLNAFRGVDRGTPVAAALAATTVPITRFRPGRAQANAATTVYDGTVPLETLVERGPPPGDPGANLRLAVEAGLRFLDFLESYGCGQLGPAYLEDFPIDPAPGAPLPDRETVGLLAIVGARVPDGFKLRSAFRTATGAFQLPPDPDTTGFPTVTDAAKAWLAWLDSIVSNAPIAQQSWQEPRSEHAFAVAARAPQGETVLYADEFGGGELDWYSLDEVSSPSLGASADAAPTAASAVLVPAPVSFGGMPSSRWFEFEDGNVNFGGVDAGPTDLARMLLIEFSSLYGNDHYVVPLELPVGSLCRIDTLDVTDNFGGRTRVLAAEKVSGLGAGAWQMFRQTKTAGGAGDYLFLAPTLAAPQESVPVEEVLFLRDEIADMAWAVEHVVEGPTGRPLDRIEEYREERRRAEAGGGTAQPEFVPIAPFRYQLRTSVPPSWIPLMPVTVGQSIRLQLRQLADEHGDPIAPRTRILTLPGGTTPFELYEEEVPRSGVRVRRSYRYVRWSDGSTHLWVARRATPGRGEGSSGLRFDVVEPSPGGPPA